MCNTYFSCDFDWKILFFHYLGHFRWPSTSKGQFQGQIWFLEYMLNFWERIIPSLDVILIGLSNSVGFKWLSMPMVIKQQEGIKGQWRGIR